MEALILSIKQPGLSLFDGKQSADCELQDVKDVVAAVDYAIDMGLAEPSRITVLGGSHGGFLTTHLIGQVPDKFVAAVARNPVCNLASMVGISDIPDWCFFEAYGDLNHFTEVPSPEDLSRFHHLSPISHVSKVKTPTLLLLGTKERMIFLRSRHGGRERWRFSEWLKSKDCYELNVIHYNIMLRILVKACKWRYVQSLWAEMIRKGINQINSTYGTLIDVYSKGLCWLGKMSKTGMQPDDVTTGIVFQMYKKVGEFQKVEEFFKKWSV